MFANYLSAALRNLLRNRAYAAINLLGLALGFTATILIALYVRNEYSYDRFIPGYERIYQFGEIIQHPGRDPVRISANSVLDAAALKLTFPDIESTTRLAPAGMRLYRPLDNEGTPVTAYWADANFFDMFRLPVMSGSLEGALSQPDGVVLTRSAANRLFNHDDAIGKTISVDQGGPVMRVVAVIEDLPSNSHLNAEAFLPGVASFSEISRLEDQQRRLNGIRTENVYSYIRLRKGATVDNVLAGSRAFADAHVPIEISPRYTFTMTPIADIHLRPRHIADMKPPADPRVLHALMGIAVLILIVACGNFISMMTARATRRAVEVGVRKAVGATRRQIMMQFLGESLFYSILALVSAIIAVELLLPAFNAFLQRQIQLDLLSDPALAWGLVALAAISGLAAGAYPALYLSSFKSNVVLRGTALLSNSSRMRALLVVFQFATLIALVITTLTVQRQGRYAIEDRLRLPTNQIYLSAGSGCPRAFVDAARLLKGVQAASCASGAALSFANVSATFVASDGTSYVDAHGAQIDSSYFGIFDIKPVAGRLLSEKYGQDDMLRDNNDLQQNPAVVINESLARALGFASPAKVVGKSIPWVRIGFVDNKAKKFEKSSSEIVGVVPDFSIGSVRDPVGPTAYFLDPPMRRYLLLRLEGGAIPETLAAVRNLWAEHQPGKRFDGIFLNQYVNDLYSDIVIQTEIFSLFAGIAVVLAALGLLGLAMFAAERRTREIGLRKVMGARRADILVLIGWQFARPVLWANLLAWPVAWLAMRRWLEGFVYHIDQGLLVFVGASALALVIALATVSWHAILVSRAKPVDALRYE